MNDRFFDTPNTQTDQYLQNTLEGFTLFLFGTNEFDINGIPPTASVKCRVQLKRAGGQEPWYCSTFGPRFRLTVAGEGTGDDL